jgi:ubiquinone/menaquinone biosynthesis C-methylase UbiE
MLFSFHDPAVIYRKIRFAGVFRRFSPLAFSASARVRARWQQIEEPLRHWWQIPTVVEILNFRISGRPNVTFHDLVCERFLNDGKERVALSLGCGIGGRELDWARRGVFKEILGLDISPDRIKKANECAEKSGLSHIAKFAVADVNAMINSGRRFDVVIFEHSLHHFADVPKVLSVVKNILSPDGFLVVDEFVGPRRFQWTRGQLSIADGLLSAMPDKYRRFPETMRAKTRNLRAGSVLMWLNDPSEAIESDRILPEIERQFQTRFRADYGGTISQFLFQDIAHHFVRDDGENLQWVRNIMSAEEALISLGVLNSDYACLVCAPRAGD